MSKRYYIELAYRGTAYNGWQYQKNAPSVQETVQESIRRLLSLATAPAVVGAGRTDTGVHASHYVAHFDCERDIEDLDDFVFRLNYVLPEDISVKRVVPIYKGFNARFAAKKRTYQYTLRTYKDPFSRDSSWQFYIDIDVDVMNKASAHLVGQHDFTTFSKLHSDNKSDLCTVFSAKWEIIAPNTYRFTIESNRFLRNMIRALVSNLVDVGRGKSDPEEFRKIFEAKDRSLSRGTAPAQGLVMTAIEYDADIFERTDELD